MNRANAGWSRKERGPARVSLSGGPAIRVLLDYRPALFGRGGIAVYTRELASAYADAWPDDPLALWGHRLRRVARPGEPRAPRGARLHAGRLPSRAQDVLARFGFGVERLAGGADVVHATDYVALPTGPRLVPLVATVHDVLFEELPACYTAGMRRGLRAVTSRLLRRAARTIVPSRHSRDALVAHYPVDPARVDVIPHGVSVRPDARAAREHGSAYVLFVGTLEPRKNLARLLDAHARLGGGTKLVIAGSRGWMDDALVDRIASAARVTWEADVTPDRLASLYRGAAVLAYPSLGEGFGLPVLEAMAYGVPVLVGADTACAELAGDAGLAVDPLDVDALAAGLAGLLEDEELRRRLGDEGRRRAARYTWEKTARATRATYEKAIQA